jgi:hypothetical protein
VLETLLYGLYFSTSFQRATCFRNPSSAIKDLVEDGFWPTRTDLVSHLFSLHAIDRTPVLRQTDFTSI